MGSGAGGSARPNSSCLLVCKFHLGKLSGFVSNLSCHPPILSGIFVQPNLWSDNFPGEERYTLLLRQSSQMLYPASQRAPSPGQKTVCWNLYRRITHIFFLHSKLDLNIFCQYCQYFPRPWWLIGFICILWCRKHPRGWGCCDRCFSDGCFSASKRWSVPIPRFPVTRITLSNQHPPPFSQGAILSSVEHIGAFFNT